MKSIKSILSLILALASIASMCFFRPVAFAAEAEGSKVAQQEETTSSVPPEKLYLGDIDRDGKVSAADARSALRMSVALEEYDKETLYYGDYIEDGKITAGDARMILRASVALEELRKPEDKLPPAPPRPLHRRSLKKNG